MKMGENILIEVIQDNHTITAKCRVSDPITTLELIKVIGDMRDDLFKQIDGFINDLLQDKDIPKDIKSLLENRKTNSSVIELIKKIRSIDNPEEKEQILRDLNGLIKGR